MGTFLYSGMNSGGDYKGPFQFGPNPFHDNLHPFALKTINASRRMIQEIRHIAQMTAAFSCMLNLCDIPTSRTKNDAVNECKQMAELKASEKADIYDTYPLVQRVFYLFFRENLIF